MVALPHASDDEICRRLSYIEFGGLNKAMPLRFSRRLWQDSIRNSGLPQDRDAFSGIDIDPVYFSVDLDAIPDSNYGDNPFIDEPADPSEFNSTPANEGALNLIQRRWRTRLAKMIREKQLTILSREMASRRF